MVGLASPEIRGISQVRCDMRDGIRRLTEHLLAQGCRVHVHLSPGNADSPMETWRWQLGQCAFGFQDAILAAGGRVLVCGPEDYKKKAARAAKTAKPFGIILCQNELAQKTTMLDPFFRGAEMAEPILSHRELLPEAVICPNDDWAFGFANEALRAGLSIPRDLAVTGFNASALADRFFVPLTSIRQPTQEMCELAIKLLLDKVDGKPVKPRIHDLPGELVLRASSLRS